MKTEVPQIPPDISARPGILPFEILILDCEDLSFQVLILEGKKDHLMFTSCDLMTSMSLMMKSTMVRTRSKKFLPLVDSSTHCERKLSLTN